MQLVRVIVAGLILAIVCSQTAIAQELCTGSLGENIFTEGDFGRGTANILPTDPQIAPGYRYNRNTPPSDGDYVLTNDMSLWEDLYASWLPIGDNSDDPLGYMMVVNASFTPGIFYEQIVDDVCENTVYEFSADVINLVRAGVTGHIRPNVSFLIDDNEFYSTGEIAQNETWQTVGFTFATAPRQTQAKLTLRNNAPGGIGNDVGLDNITFRACGPPATVVSSTEGVICEDSSFPTLSAMIDDTTSSFIQWQISIDTGMTWDDMSGGTTPSFQVAAMSPGFYLYRFIQATSLANLMNEKCRTISESLPLEVVPLEYTVADTICDGLSYRLGDTTYTETGVYLATFKNFIGCDSIVTLELQVLSDPQAVPDIIIEAPSCNGRQDGSLVLNDVPGGYPPFVMTDMASGEQSADSLIRPAGDYEILITDKFGCNSTDIYTVPLQPPFILTPPNDTLINLGAVLPIDIGTNYSVDSVVWTPPDYAECSSCLITNIRPLQSISYKIRGVNERGCVTETVFSVQVEKIVNVYAPNVFSPNADGVNDLWGLYVDPLVVGNVDELLIVDRYGGMLFQLENIAPVTLAEIWDGTSGGKLVDPGVYVYMARLTLIDGSEQQKSGTITALY